jgi:uncharacterized protein (DUF924 family)
MLEPQNKPIATKLKEKASSYGKNLKRKKITYLHKLFRNKGSGFYGVGYIVTLLYLEVTAFFEEAAEFSFSWDNLIGQLVSHFISFSIETIVNLIKASIWPFIVYSNFTQAQAVILLVLTAVLYFYANKRWNISEVYENKFGIQSASEIIHLWQENNPNFGDFKALIIDDESSILYQLAVDADQQHLENWRHQPESCFALLILLLSEPKHPNLEYCCDVVFAAIDEGIDVEMPTNQRFHFYQSVITSASKRQQKILHKALSRLRKKLSSSEQSQIDNLLNQL